PLLALLPRHAVHVFHQRADRLVEVKPVQISGDLRDGLLRPVSQLAVIAGSRSAPGGWLWVRVPPFPRSRTPPRAREAGVGVPVGFVDHVPDPLQEPVHTFDATAVPWAAPFPGPDEL